MFNKANNFSFKNGIINKDALFINKIRALSSNIKN